MRWRGRRQSENIEDRRGVSGPAIVGGGMGLMILALIVALFGGNPQRFLQQAKQQKAAPAEQRGANGGELSPAEKERGDFAAVVFADTEDVWDDLFARAGKKYPHPKMVLFSGSVQSKCGGATAQSGPFYCPADGKVYLDTTFFRQLSEQMNAPGDFAQAYVIAHEVGHHVQNVLGYTDKVERVRRSGDKIATNQASVRLELQADFFAGCMLHHAQRTKNIIEPGDVEEALRAATAIGDDRLQAKGRGRVDHESFTHGTSEQRLRWFMLGLQSGDLQKGDTFGMAYDNL